MLYVLLLAFLVAGPYTGFILREVISPSIHRGLTLTYFALVVGEHIEPVRPHDGVEIIDRIAIPPANECRPV